MNDPEIDFKQGVTEGLLSSFLCYLTMIIEERTGEDAAGGFLGGPYGYGVDYENETLMVHPYCWCERDDCPWCAHCTCPDGAWTYTVDGQPVSWDEWIGTFNKAVEPYKSESNAWQKAADEVNKRRDMIHTPSCAFCKGESKQAPNFWHKPSGLKVSWYKYIGRDMKIEMPESLDLLAMMKECVDSVRLESGDHD